MSPLRLQIAYLSVFKEGGEGLYNIICRSLFHYYSDLSYYSAIYFFLPYILPFKKEGRRERKGKKKKNKKEKGGYYSPF
jgi:hypothetical protein